MNLFEVIGAAIGLAYIVSEYRADRWFWPLSLLMSLFYIVIDFTSGLYANGSICCYNFIMSVYGLLVWRGIVQSKDKTERPITSCPARYWPWIVGAVALLTVVMHRVLGMMANTHGSTASRRRSQSWPCGCCRRNTGNNGYCGS